jgi:hypothetical protein
MHLQLLAREFYVNNYATTYHSNNKLEDFIQTIMPQHVTAIISWSVLDKESLITKVSREE